MPSSSKRNSTGFLFFSNGCRTALLLDFSGEVEMDEKRETNGAVGLFPTPAVRPANTPASASLFTVLSRPSNTHSDQASYAEN